MSKLSEYELRRALGAYGSAMIDDYERGIRMGKEKVHHTLPIANVTACGLACSPVASHLPAPRDSGIIRETVRQSGRDITYSYDLSKVTCTECAKRLTTPVTDAENRQAVEDAGWLRTQGEDFHSLRALVEQVNEAEKLLVGDDSPFASGTRAGFVNQCAGDLYDYQEGDEDEDETSDEESCDVCGAEDGDVRTICTDCAGGCVPRGGLSHDHTNWLVRKVRGAITDLRTGQAWPDDARRVAAELEDRLDKILGTNDEPKREDFHKLVGAVSCEPKT